MQLCCLLGALCAPGKWPVGGCMMELGSTTQVGGLLCLPDVYFAQKGVLGCSGESEFRLCVCPNWLQFSPSVLRRAKSLWSSLLCSCSRKPARKWKQMASSQWLVGISRCWKTANEVWGHTEEHRGCCADGACWLLALCWGASYPLSGAEQWDC